MISVKDKDALIQKLQDNVKDLNTELKDKEPEYFSGYTCSKCGIRNNFSFTLPTIKGSGLCGSCYHEK